MHYSFWAAAAAIALLDIVLSGANALVIGAAASRLQRSQRMVAIALGGLGAIVMRLVLTSVATTLLLVPYLRFGGGIAIFIIAVRLLLPEGTQNRELRRDGLLPAIVTIIIADITMSLDNVIAVGGLADGNVVLLVAGVTFSMLLLFVASSIIAQITQRMRWLVDVAAVVLAWTAANLILDDPAFRHLAPVSDNLRLATHFYFVAAMLLIDLFLRALLRHQRRSAARAEERAGAEVPHLAQTAATEDMRTAGPAGPGPALAAPAELVDVDGAPATAQESAVRANQPPR
ncbi:MAG: YjbE family putative metal transport protein [Ktedonobacterales bacterium]